MRPGPRSQSSALDDTDVGLESVCTGDDDDLADSARADALEDEWQQESLLGCAEPARGAGRQDDGSDHQPPRRLDGLDHDVDGRDPGGVAEPPMRVTVSNPDVTSPITA